MNKIINFLKPFSLNFLLVFNIFFIIIFTLLAVTLTTYFGMKYNWVDMTIFTKPTTNLLIIFALSIILTNFLVIMIRFIFIRNIEKMIASMQQIAQYNYRSKLDFDGYYIPETIKEYEQSFNKTIDTLNKTEILQLDFINNFSHELKTPITSILGFAQLLSSPNISDQERIEYSNIIQEEAIRLSNLSTNILNLSKIDNLNNITTQSVNCSELITHVINIIGHENISNNKFKLHLESFEIECSKELIIQLLMNIISNSIKYSDPNTEIIIKADSSDSHCTISIQDFGAGMDETTIENMYSKFYRANTTHISGYGIGLSVAKKIIELHNGNIDVISELGQGSTFTITLPLYQK